MNIPWSGPSLSPDSGLGGAKYTGKTFTKDLIVAGIVTVMLIPQSLAYALLGGLSPQFGLYVSIRERKN